MGLMLYFPVSMSLAIIIIGKIVAHSPLDTRSMVPAIVSNSAKLLMPTPFEVMYASINLRRALLGPGMAKLRGVDRPTLMADSA